MKGSKLKALLASIVLLGAVLASACVYETPLPVSHVAEEFAICTDPDIQTNPAISGDIYGARLEWD